MRTKELTFNTGSIMAQYFIDAIESVVSDSDKHQPDCVIEQTGSETSFFSTLKASSSIVFFHQCCKVLRRNYVETGNYMFLVLERKIYKTLIQKTINFDFFPTNSTRRFNFLAFIEHTYPLVFAHKVINSPEGRYTRPLTRKKAEHCINHLSENAFSKPIAGVKARMGAYGNVDGDIVFFFKRNDQIHYEIICRGFSLITEGTCLEEDVWSIILTFGMFRFQRKYPEMDKESVVKAIVMDLDVVEQVESELGLLSEEIDVEKEGKTFKNTNFYLNEINLAQKSNVRKSSNIPVFAKEESLTFLYRK